MSLVQNSASFAKLSPLQQLKRLTGVAVLSKGLKEDSWGETGSEIFNLVLKCNPNDIADLAISLRRDQMLKSVPLLLVKHMFNAGIGWREQACRALVELVRRPDELTKFLAMYWSNGKVPLANQLKKAFRLCLSKFDEYQLAKYQNGSDGISLRDIMYLCHAKPADLPADRDFKWDKAARRSYKAIDSERKAPFTKQEELYLKLSEGKLDIPATREVLLSEATGNNGKKVAYEALLANNKLGVVALVKNLKALHELGVDRNLVSKACSLARVHDVLPLDYIKAYLEAPIFRNEIESMLLRSSRKGQGLSGTTVAVVDISGSMEASFGYGIESKYHMTHMKAVTAMLISTQAACENLIIYLTGGNDHKYEHKTVRLHLEDRGLTVWDRFPSYIEKCGLGGPNRGGIFTRQALDFIRKDLGPEVVDSVDRLLVFSDSQDCDRANKIPKPFGKTNYIINVRSSKNSVNFKGVWTQEITGWSPAFLEYIQMCEQQ